MLRGKYTSSFIQESNDLILDGEDGHKITNCPIPRLEDIGNRDLLSLLSQILEFSLHRNYLTFNYGGQRGLIT